MPRVKGYSAALPGVESTWASGSIAAGTSIPEGVVAPISGTRVLDGSRASGRLCSSIRLLRCDALATEAGDQSFGRAPVVFMEPARHEVLVLEMLALLARPTEAFGQGLSLESAHHVGDLFEPRLAPASG